MSTRPVGKNARSVDESARPVDVCRALLSALDATEGRRRRRKRNTSADAIGIGMKRSLLEAAVADDPDPAAFEGWLLERCFEQGPGEGAWRAMALEIFHEWRMAEAAPSFRAWLESGAPSDDKPGRGGEGRERDGARTAEDRGGGRRRLPVVVVLLGLASALGAACDRGIDAKVEDVPAIEVREMTAEARQRTGVTAVLEPMLTWQRLDDVVYNPPVELARPAGADVWPPPTGRDD